MRVGPVTEEKQFGDIFKGQKTVIEKRANIEKVQDAHLVAGKHHKI